MNINSDALPLNQCASRYAVRYGGVRNVYRCELPIGHTGLRAHSDAELFWDDSRAESADTMTPATPERCGQRYILPSLGSSTGQAYTCGLAGGCESARQHAQNAEDALARIADMARRGLALDTHSVVVLRTALQRVIDECERGDR